MATQTSPNMNIVVPIASSELGPAWASELQTALYTTIDQHTHASGKGIAITPSGLNINADLPFGSTNNATLLRTVRLVLQAANPSLGTDIGCIYEGPTGDLWYNDSSGAQIQLTANHTVKSASALTGPVVGTTRTVTTTYTVDSITPDYDLYCDTTGGAFTVTLPTATVGRQLAIIDAKGNFGTANLTVTTTGGAKIAGLSTVKVLSAPWSVFQLKSNGTDWFGGGA